jgi:DNA-binding response OmpR family regulator
MAYTTGFWPLPTIQRGSLVASSQADDMPDRSLRVVVVDDNYDANAALTRLLEKAGFEVAGRAYDGLSGLNVIKETHPDVAILDIAMPALDGFALARRVRNEVNSPPRLVALTGFGSESDRATAADAGFDAYFRKPANWQAMESLLNGFAGGTMGQNADN